eukprot:7377511-Prymnesium_polylepis.1
MHCSVVRPQASTAAALGCTSWAREAGRRSCEARRTARRRQRCVSTTPRLRRGAPPRAAHASKRAWAARRPHLRSAPRSTGRCGTEELKTDEKACPESMTDWAIGFPRW